MKPRCKYRRYLRTLTQCIPTFPMKFPMSSWLTSRLRCIQQLRHRGRGMIRILRRLRIYRITRSRHRRRLKLVVRQRQLGELSSSWPWRQCMTWSWRHLLKPCMFPKLRCMGKLIRWWYRWQWRIWSSCPSNLHCIHCFRISMSSQLIIIQRSLPIQFRRWHRLTLRHRWLRKCSMNRIVPGSWLG